jgi:hypothetical protein
VIIEPMEVVCVHHWRIEEQNGTDTVMGTCAKCGATRPYSASSYIDWNPYAVNANKRRPRFGAMPDL